MAEVPEGSVVVTPREMYDEIKATHDVVRDIKTLVSGQHDRTEDHETRLRSVERKVWSLSGGAAVVGAIAGIAAGAWGH